MASFARKLPARAAKDESDRFLAFCREQLKKLASREVIDGVERVVLDENTLWYRQKQYLDAEFGYAAGDFDQVYTDVLSLRRVDPLQHWGRVLTRGTLDPDIQALVSLLINTHAKPSMPEHPLSRATQVNAGQEESASLLEAVLAEPAGWPLATFMAQANRITFEAYSDRQWLNADDPRGTPSPYLKKLFEVSARDTEFRSTLLQKFRIPIVSVCPNEVFVFASPRLEERDPGLFAGLNSVGVFHYTQMGVDRLADALKRASMSPTDIAVLLTGNLEFLLAQDPCFDLAVNDTELFVAGFDASPGPLSWADRVTAAIHRPQTLGPFRLRYTDRFKPLMPRGVNRRLLATGVSGMWRIGDF